VSDAAIPVASAAEARAFLDLPARLAPLGWGVPLRFEERRLFDPARNGFLADHATVRFLVRRGAEVVGRIAACVPREGPGPATFGFLRCIEDRSVLAALLDAAGAFAAGHGRAALDGPLSFTINHEVGAQLSAFDRAPMLRMPRTPAWLPALLDACGAERLERVVACTLDMARERHRARFAAIAARRPREMARLRLRLLDRGDWRAEVARIAALYDDAWAGNRHSVPLRAGEVATMATLLRPLLWAGEVVFAEWDGAPVGLVAIVPNIEPALPPDGRLLPFGWARLLPALAGRTADARIPMLGIARRFRGHPASALAMGALLAEAIGVAARRGWRQVEVSWVLHDNSAMLNAMMRLPAPVSGEWGLWRCRPGAAEN
jgi:hypothetical protein